MGDFYIFFFLYNKLQSCNNYQVLFASRARIQNNAGGCVHPVHEGPLFYKKDRRPHHNQRGRAHQGIQYAALYMSTDGL